MNSILQKTSQGYFFGQDKLLKSSRTYLLSARYSVINHSPEIKTIVHPFWVLDYSFVNCGACRVGRRKNAWFERPSGSMHLYSPKTQYWEDGSSVRPPLLSSYIAFCGGGELDLVKHVNNGDGFCRFIDKTGRAGGLFVEAAAEAARGGEKSYWRVMSKFYGIIDLIHSATNSTDGSEKLLADPDVENVRSREMTFVEEVRKYLQKHVDKNISIADLAIHMNASVSTISHKYMQLTEESPMKTLTTFRINAVKNLLAKGESIKSISAQTGFCDEFHLSKVFKKATGASPSAYMKSLTTR